MIACGQHYVRGIFLNLSGTHRELLNFYNNSVLNVWDGKECWIKTPASLCPSQYDVCGVPQRPYLVGRIPCHALRVTIECLDPLDWDMPTKVHVFGVTTRDLVYPLTPENMIIREWS